MSEMFTFLDFLVLEFSAPQRTMPRLQKYERVAPLNTGEGGKCGEGQLGISNHRQPLLFIFTLYVYHNLEKIGLHHVTEM